MAKDTCESLNQLSVSSLLKYGFFAPYQKEGILDWRKNNEIIGRIRIIINAENAFTRCIYEMTFRDGAQKDFDYTISVEATDCHFGGRRFWFLCPIKISGSICARRCGVLYLKEGIFGCRNCHNLSYESQQENHAEKWAAMSQYLRSKSLSSPLPRVKYWRGRLTRRLQKELARRLKQRGLAESICASKHRI